MDNLSSLYALAEHENIDVDWFCMKTAESLSAPIYGTYCVALNPAVLTTQESETVHLAHELGHCFYGGFYNRWATCEIRQRHERRADVWAIKKLIPKDELIETVRNGYREPWEIAERFNVTQPFAEMAMRYYGARETA